METSPILGLNNLLKSCDLNLESNLDMIKILIENYLGKNVYKNKSKLNLVVNGTNQMIIDIDSLLKLIPQFSNLIQIDWEKFLKKISNTNECIRLMEKVVVCLMSKKNADNLEQLRMIKQNLDNFKNFEIYFEHKENLENQIEEVEQDEEVRNSLVELGTSIKSFQDISNTLVEKLSNFKLSTPFEATTTTAQKANLCLMEIYDKKIICKINYSTLEKINQTKLLFKYEFKLE
ncbi:unnamed protein product [Brachionus calyciflorus]|uniref:Uncharacterized protein n=1 Tax=Brachionus calyciflorus TaxID=104777 RepID=A0A813W060_9BILA|nr:unnamed protein product [Brachionus calyciflorus]